jgi:hypothetical protein
MSRASPLNIDNLVTQLELRGGVTTSGLDALVVETAGSRLLDNGESFINSSVVDSEGALPLPIPTLKGLLLTVENYTTDSEDNGIYLCTGDVWNKLQDLY